LTDVKITSDWKFNKNSFDADIAVVSLFNPVEITNDVQPICLPPFSWPLIQAGGVVVRKIDGEYQEGRQLCRRLEEAFNAN
jgi:hypothetical protein